MRNFNRDRLEAIGAASYVLGEVGGDPAILCLVCGTLSSHPTDITEKYCGRCHKYHFTARITPPGTQTEHDAKECFPERGRGVLVLFSNGDTAIGYWNGEFWMNARTGRGFGRPLVVRWKEYSWEVKSGVQDGNL